MSVTFIASTGLIEDKTLPKIGRVNKHVIKYSVFRDDEYGAEYRVSYYKNKWKCLVIILSEINFLSYLQITCRQFSESWESDSHYGFIDDIIPNNLETFGIPKYSKVYYKIMEVIKELGTDKKTVKFDTL